jgi:hypothetical protein
LLKIQKDSILTYSGKEVHMQTASYGIYKNGQIILDEPAIKKDNARVLVVFLDKESEDSKLLDIFKLYGSWEDSRDAETIIQEIRSSRMSSGNAAFSPDSSKIPQSPSWDWP